MGNGRTALLLLSALAASSSAAADREKGGQPAGRPVSTAVVSIGAFDAENAGQRASEAGVQYRLPWSGWHLQPTVGGMATSAGAVSLYAGVSVEAPVGRHLSLRGSFAPGYYTPGRAGKDLGSALEFRSGLEVAVRLSGGWRVGVEYYHLSNAGLGRINPGQESLVLTLAIPVGRRRAPASMGASSS